MMLELCNKFLEIFNNSASMDVKQTLSYGFGVFALYLNQSTYPLANVFTAL